MSRLIRLVLEVLFAAWLVTVVAVALAAQLAPLTGLHLLAVRTASMAPALEPADLVAIEPVAPATIQPGDVISVALDGGAVVTHRVAGVVEADDGPTFVTRGDANPAADPVAARPDQVRGRAVWRLPLAGIPLAMLATPAGIIALLSVAAVLAIAIWLLDDLELERAERAIESELEDLRGGLAPGANPA